ncbi:MAG: alpha-amylase/4-alpha-glucanotransferase domain-containing protein [Thermoguttaceae bacterium]
MPNPVSFIFALHNHQPIGNFGHLIEQSYRESYLPFLDVFAEYPDVKLSLHTSGSLVEWLDEQHPEYLDRIAELAQSGRIEIIGGPFFEPILAMLPSRDRIGQIERYRDWLKKRLGIEVLGIWTPERVWEQSYVRDLQDVGIQFTVLDDFHFKNAGLPESALWKYYMSEDNGRTLAIFPGNERLRYLIPFRTIEETIDYFAQQGDQQPGSILVHADDGEKFGNWPNTFGSVFEERWLHRFFQALSDNAGWLQSRTFADVLATQTPLGTIYLPDGSYREMTEWVLPPDAQSELKRLKNELESQPIWSSIRRFIRGGFWRNFKVRYPETNEMYARMMSVSSRLHHLEEQLLDEDERGEIFERAKESLYRGQCNCAYWHGAFGGIYLPHLRNAVYHQLIQADSLLDSLERTETSWVETDVADFNFDGQNEIRLANEYLSCWIIPHCGGMIYELDWNPICHNVLATMTRGPESYHGLIHSMRGEGGTDSGGNRVVFKQQGLDQRIQYDTYPRKSLVDLFYDADVEFEPVRLGTAQQHGSFVLTPYHSVIRRKPGRIQVLLTAQGVAYGATFQIQKAITLSAGSKTLEIAYKLDGLPTDYRLHFAVELNFAGMPGHAEDRYFLTNGSQKLGNLSTNLDLYNAGELSLLDDWLGLRADLTFSRATNLYAFPIESVSQSEGGFELVHQSVCVQPHWLIQPQETDSWTVEMELTLG